MKLMLVDYGKDISRLEDLLKPLAQEYSFAGLEYSTDIIKVRSWPFIYRVFKQFLKWIKK